jgi:hypothetical protein
MRTGFAVLVAAGGLSLSACAGTQAVGTARAYADGYYAGKPNFDPSACWASGWAGTFDYPYCGWYDGFYPGNGTYVYGRDQRPHVWTPGQQNHWVAPGPRLTNGMHGPGPVTAPGGKGFAPPAAGADGGMGRMRGGHGIRGGGFGGGHGGGSHFPRVGHSGR